MGNFSYTPFSAIVLDNRRKKYLFVVFAESSLLDVTDGGIVNGVRFAPFYADVMSLGTVLSASLRVQAHSAEVVSTVSARPIHLIEVDFGMSFDCAQSINVRQQVDAAIMSLNILARLGASTGKVLKVRFAETFGSKLEGNMRRVITSLLISERVAAYISAGTLGTFEAVLDVTLSQGDRVVIDMQRRTAYLYGQEAEAVNVLDKFSGDWFKISKVTEQVLLGSSTGGDLDGVLVVTEEYL